jgi:hypothetical protein
MRVSESAIRRGPLAGASFHPVAGGGVLFDAAQGRLYALNPTAGMTWLCIRDGLSANESTLALANAFKVDQTIAAEWLRISTDRFQDLGLFENVGSTTAACSPRVREKSQKSGLTSAARRAPRSDYRVFEQILHLFAPPGPLVALESLLATLRTDPADQKELARPDIEIDIVAHGDRWDILVDGKLETTCEAKSTVAEVERLLIQRVVPATPHLLALHAAALQRGGRTWLLSGLSGAGKTTLSLALAQAGWGFGSDEIVLLGRDQDLRALPLPPCVKADSFRLIETWFPELRSAPEHERYGYIVKYLPIRSIPISAKPGFVVFVRFISGGLNELQPLDHFSAMERLLSQCVFVPPGFQHNDVKQLLRWHSEQNYFDLSFCDCNAAVEILAQLAANRS